MVFLISTIVIETSFTIRSSNDNLRITVEDESGNQTPYIKRRGRTEKEEEDEDSVKNIKTGAASTKEMKHKNIYMPVKPSIDQQVLSFKNRLLSKLGINKENNKTAAAITSINQVRNRRELILDCGQVQIQQTFVVNGCSQTIQVSACTGSCPNAGNGRSACRTTVSHDVPLRFDCTGVSTVIYITMADYCSCTKLWKVLFYYCWSKLFLFCYLCCGIAR